MTIHDPISTPFTASSTADEVLQGVDLTGVRAIVTGGSSGIWGSPRRCSASLSDSGGGHGVTGMRDRILPLGGCLEAGPHGAGWRVRAEVPVPR